MAKKRSNFDVSLSNNGLTYWQYFNRLLELSVSMFEWHNLPDSVDPRYLEITLFSEGKAVYFKDEVLGDLALRCAASGWLNVYGIPTQRRAYAANGYQKELNDENSVIIWNNYIHTNSFLDVLQFAKRLYTLDRIIDVNVNAQKTPVLVLANEQQRLTMLNLYMKYEGNEPYIFGDKNLDINAIKVLKTDAPYLGDQLYRLKTQYWNEALTYLGISNVNIQKKERLISDEAIRSAGGTIASRYSRLNARREAAEQINKMFGTDISVDFRDDFREADDEVMFRGDSGNTGKSELQDMVVDLRTN